MANVNLKKVPRVMLTKNQVICLTKDGSKNSSNLHKVFFGANWSAIKTYRTENYTPGFLGRLFGKKAETREVVESIENVDLDASILMYDSDCRRVDVVYYGHKVSNCGSISHSGDDVTGDLEDDEDDNETISIDLDRVNQKVKFLVVILNSYRHHKFDKIPYAGLRIYTGKAGKPDEVLAAYKVGNNPEFKGKEAMVLGYFYRTDSGWEFKAAGTSTSERSIAEMADGSAKSLIKSHNKYYGK